MFGCRTILHLLECRTTESTVFSVSDRKTLWNREEDDLHIQDVGMYDTSDVLGRDWREVASELTGSLPQYYKERYRIPDTLSPLAFVFLRVTFRGSTSLLCVSNDNRSQGSDTVYESPPSPTPSPSPPSSLTHVHRCIGYHNPN